VWFELRPINGAQAEACLLVAERMHPFEMTRALIDMESITENEKQVANTCSTISPGWRRL